MITVIASIKVKPEYFNQFIEIFSSNVPNVLEEVGCIEYYPTVDADSGLDIQDKDSSTLTVVEKWQSVEALHNHLQAPHMQAYQAEVKEMVMSVSAKVLQAPAI